MSSSSRRGRTLRPDAGRGETETEETTAAAEETTEAPAAPAARGKQEFKPYTGKDSLPDYTVKNGIVTNGEPRYSVLPQGSGAYKLLSWFRTPSGLVKQLVTTFHPRNKKKPNDAVLLATLKKAGIPGAF